jgi:hypothetical protein
MTRSPSTVSLCLETAYCDCGLHFLQGGAHARGERRIRGCREAVRREPTGGVTRNGCKIGRSRPVGRPCLTTRPPLAQEMTRGRSPRFGLRPRRCSLAPERHVAAPTHSSKPHREALCGSSRPRNCCPPASCFDPGGRAASQSRKSDANGETSKYLLHRLAAGWPPVPVFFKPRGDVIRQHHRSIFVPPIPLVR